EAEMSLGRACPQCELELTPTARRPPAPKLACELIRVGDGVYARSSSRSYALLPFLRGYCSAPRPAVPSLADANSTAYAQRSLDDAAWYQRSNQAIQRRLRRTRPRRARRPRRR